VAGILLTGGASRRMGTDKSVLAAADGRPLAARTGCLLAAVTALAVEVGPGRSGLPAVAEHPPAAGPLAAVAAGVAWLAAAGWHGPALVVSTDLPLLDAPLLAWLAAHPAPANVVPAVDGFPQWLCARYDGPTLAAAGGLVAAGQRRLAALFAGRLVHLAAPEEWTAAGAGPLAPIDADTPEELALLTGGAQGARR